MIVPRSMAKTVCFDYKLWRTCYLEGLRLAPCLKARRGQQWMRIAVRSVPAYPGAAGAFGYCKKHISSTGENILGDGECLEYRRLE